ncbi:Neuropeptide-Like Protein [Caenorhabditis elegans]|uniref:Neuropeptide-Like Protein n=1 Tax=Caenorhabditis elegans TaxID=6239 RepID=B1Q234_CAEEL|nr:Neuropeptide-Like Protein [Caenorhabditis elegans]CCD62258.1 Neuropeptide-Like Protein [Caenorhabditis elegans]|eukprot:NP_001123089.1 Uncharacterized protein CELE_B0563.10 [Caenorhabditis elegans]
MNVTLVFLLLFVCFISIHAQQQWSPQQLAAYRQQYYNWWYNQQRMQQQIQSVQAIQQAQTPSPFFGNSQSDSKGNYWHGDDNAKLLLIARSSWP